MQGYRGYDDIIIGAGSAGAVLAARLSGEQSRRVALVEAGPYYADQSSTPADLLDGNTMSLVRHSWGHSAQLTAGRRTAMPQGKVAGGSSAIGNTVAVRGTPADYDEWAALGNPLWSWEHALPALAAIENDLDFGGDKYHGAVGPLPIRRWRPEELTEVQQAFLDACLDRGHPWAPDQNHPESFGVGPIPSTRRDPATRVSTAMAYLWPAAQRGNLEILSGARADRVVFRDGRAAGVIVDGVELAANRVILAAGALATPGILWRSGIGPAEDLRRLGIGVLADLPGVGAGLTDQPRIGVFFTPKPGQENEGRSTGQIILRTDSAQPDSRFNDMYYAMVNRFDLAHHFPQLRGHADGTIVCGVMAVARRAHSRGSVVLDSADPAAPARVDLGYLSDERDYALLAEAVRGCWDLVMTPAIAQHAKRMVMVDETTLASEGAMREYVSAAADTAFNPVGTAKMGPAEDPMTVVDQHCAVHGVEGLHVADASVMPSMVCANTLLSVLMIAERASELLIATQ